MPRIHGITRAFRLALTRSRAAEDVDAELCFHLDMKTEALVRGGMAPDAARAEALRQFGDARRFARDCEAITRQREVAERRAERLESVWQDVRYAGRALRRSPGFALVAALSLGLGVGANTMVFAWMEGLVFRPLPLVRDQERLVQVGMTSAGQESSGGASYPDYVAWREQARSFDGLAAHRLMDFNLRTGAGSERVWGELASENFFDVLGVRAALGRTFTEEDARLGAPPVAVISDGLWRRRFAADPGVVGRRAFLNDRDVTVVGVAPRGFRGAEAGLSLAIWIPVAAAPLFDQHGDRLTWRQSRWLTVIGRLHPDATLGEARAELRTIGAHIAAEFPDNRGLTPVPTPLSRAGVSSFVRPFFAALLGVTAVLVVIACASVANLLLARATVRQREIGIRLAMGASRERVVRQLLVESAVLATLGGLAGVAITLWARSLLGAFLPATQLPVEVVPALSGRVLAAAVGVTLATAFLFGVVPALRASRPELARALAAGTPGAGSGRSRLRNAIVVAQMALSVIALVSAGLFLRSLHELQGVDPGFGDPARVLLVSTNLHLGGHEDSSGTAVVDRLVESLRALPGVSTASVATAVPLGFETPDGYDTTVEGYVPASGERVATGINAVGPGYFETMRIPIVRGRALRTEDRAGAPLAVVVSEAFARRYWPGQDPIGRRVKHTYTPLGWMTVVGVAADVKYRGLGETPQPLVYLPFAQRYDPYVTLHLRTAGDPAAITQAVRRVVAAVDPGLPVLEPRTLQEHMGAALFIQRTAAGLLGTFAAVALVMTMVGLYGVVAYSVAQRRRELGVRMALGATPHDIRRLVVRHGVALAAAGVVTGAAGGVAVARLLGGLLYGVGPADPTVLVGVSALLAVVAAAASYIPARRAAKAEPVILLRTE